MHAYPRVYGLNATQELDGILVLIRVHGNNANMDSTWPLDRLNAFVPISVGTNTLPLLSPALVQSERSPGTPGLPKPMVCLLFTDARQLSAKEFAFLVRRVTMRLLKVPKPKAVSQPPPL